MLRITCIRLFLAIIAGIMLIGVFSCTSQDEDKPAVSKPAPEVTTASPAIGSTPVDPKSVDKQPADIQPVEAPGQLVISPGAEIGSRLYTSWPLFIKAGLWRKALLPDGQRNLPPIEPITLKATSGSWREALVLAVKDASGNSIAWPFHLVKQPDESVVLGVDDSESAQWWLDPSETRELVPGEYTITVSFNPDLMAGLPAYIVSDRFHLRIEKEPSPLDPAAESEKQLEMAMFSMFKQDMNTANNIVDTLLSADPENIGGLRLKSKLLVHESKNREAVSALDNAMESYFKQYPDACPPAGILQERAELLKDMEPEKIKDSKSGSPQ